MTEAATSPWSQLESSSLNGLTDIRTVVAELLANAKQAFDRDREMAWRCIVHAAAMIEGIGRPQSAQTIHQGGLAPWQVRRVKAYIDAKLANRIVIRELSEVARLSPSHFSRAFKRSFGAAPYAFILAVGWNMPDVLCSRRMLRCARSPWSAGFPTNPTFHACSNGRWVRALTNGDASAEQAIAS